MVALTREEGKNDALRNAIMATNLKDSVECVDLPSVETVIGDDCCMLGAALVGREWAWVVVTSPEAAAVLCEEWSDNGKPNLRAAAVGEATADVLRKFGITVGFVPSKATGRTLVDELPPAEAEEIPPDVLYPASELAGPVVEEGLRAKGYNVVRLNTYSTESAVWPADFKETAKTVSVVTFASPSSVQGWIRNCAPEDSLKVACIGETSRKAAIAAGFLESNVYCPESPSVANWVDAISNALRGAPELASAREESQ